MSPRTANLVIFFSSWFLTAVWLGWYDHLRPLPRPVLQLILAALLLLLVVLHRWWPDFRSLVDACGPRTLIGLHVTRFVGILFLQLGAREMLPASFAQPAGWGDIAIAASALVVLALPLRRNWARRIAWTWNLIGLVDILLVVANAARLGIQNPVSMIPLTHLPLSLLPTFLVPLIIGSHLVLFSRLRAPKPAPAPAAA